MNHSALGLDRRLEWLEAMRGLAACWVLLHHAKQSVDAFIGPMNLAGQFIANGYLGVDFFFVLSGFIIAHSSNRLADSGRGLSDYAKARFIRIYAPYLPIGIAMLLVYILIPQLSAGNRQVGVFTSLTLLPSTAPVALSVAWTLVHEVIFYFVFSLFFVSRKLLLFVFAIWTAAISTSHLLELSFGREGWGYFLSPLNLCFILGTALYYIVKNGISRPISWALLWLASIALIVDAAQDSPSRWLAVFGFSGLIMFATSEPAKNLSPGRWLILLGGASYAIYLVHNPVLSLSIRLVNRTMLASTPVVAFLTIILVSLLAGLLYHFAYERYAIKTAKIVFELNTSSLREDKKS